MCSRLLQCASSLCVRPSDSLWVRKMAGWLHCAHSRQGATWFRAEVIPCSLRQNPHRLTQRSGLQAQTEPLKMCVCKCVCLYLSRTICRRYRTVCVFVTLHWASLERYVTFIMSYCTRYIINSAISHSCSLFKFTNPLCNKHTDAHTNTHMHYKAAGYRFEQRLCNKPKGHRHVTRPRWGFLHVQVSRICKISKMDQKYIT